MAKQGKSKGTGSEGNRAEGTGTTSGGDWHSPSQAFAVPAGVTDVGSVDTAVCAGRGPAKRRPITCFSSAPASPPVVR